MDYTKRDFMRHGGYITVTLMDSTSCVDVLESQLNYDSTEVIWEVYITV